MFDMLTGSFEGDPRPSDTSRPAVCLLRTSHTFYSLKTIYIRGGLIFIFIFLCFRVNIVRGCCFHILLLSYFGQGGKIFKKIIYV